MKHNSIFFRLPGRAKYQTKEEVLESIYIDSTASCFGDINAQRENEIPEYFDSKSEKEDTVSRNESQRSRSVGGSWPNLNEELKATHLSEDSIGPSRNPSEIDSLDSNYVRKHYNFEAHRKVCKGSSPETERSLASPVQTKEKFLNIEEVNTDNEDKDIEQISTHTPKSIANDNLPASEEYKSEIIALQVTNKLPESYDKASITSKLSQIDEDVYEKQIPQIIIETSHENDTQSIASENDEIISSPPDSITSYISISIASSDKSHKLEYLANSLAEKIDEYCDSQFKENGSVASQTINSEIHNQHGESIYNKVSKKKTFADISRDSFSNQNGNLFNEILKNQNNELYVSNTYIDCDNYSSKSNCTLKNITTEPFVTTLIENQYYSLPDINIGKCLRKSERIDAQLREEDPEDVPCENTYEIAQTHFREILSAKSNKNYGQINKTQVSPNYNINIHKNIYLPEYSEPQILNNFSKIDDDLKSIITVESSNADEKESNFYHTDCHENEREINEIEGTIRNNKLITKSESLKVTSYSDYRSEINDKVKSYSNDNINNSIQDKKAKTNIRKHYSLRQREPSEDEQRVPSPETVELSLTKNSEPAITKSSQLEEIKNQSLLSRVQSFKTSADSSIAIVPLSGHQTIVIDPPLSQNSNSDNNLLTIIQQDLKQDTIKKVPDIQSEKETTVDKFAESKNSEFDIDIDKSSYSTPKDPFKTIKLNKVVKTTIPTFKKETSEKIASVQHKFEKPPSKLIIKDSSQLITETSNKQLNKLNKNMSRPQVLQVIDSKNRKNNVIGIDKNSENYMLNNLASQKRNSIDVIDNKTVNTITCNAQTMENNLELNKDTKETKTGCVKEKLNDAIKTDIEYQEKISSVKNYWSKLADKSDVKPENKVKQEDHNNNNTNEKTEEKVDDDRCIPEISVGNIIKSLESVKIVDSIKKITQNKLQLWKEDTEKVKSDTEVEETPTEKIIKSCESNIYDKTKMKSKTPETDMSRETPEIEIVELSSDDQNHKTQATLIKAKGYENGCDEFDHVRYKVMKSELFKNSMIANYRKEAQFDGLLQYLQDYSFQELLVNNNIVIIEPVRTKVEPAPRKNTDTCKIPPTLLKKNENTSSQVDKSKNAIRRHFFYHPIRVNKEIIEEELPNPDTVKKVRNLFEDTLKMRSPTQDPPLVNENGGLTRRATSYRNLSEESKSNKIGGRKKVIRQLTIDTNYGNKKWDNASLSSGVSSGDLSSNNEFDTDGLSPYSQKHLKDNAYSSSDEYLCDSMSQDFCCESQYVSPDILKKIRECGTSVTYYGGKVLNSKTPVSHMTKAIMEEIKSLQKNCSRDCYSCQTKCRGDRCSCLVADKHQQMVLDKQNSKASSVTISNSQEQNKRSETFPGFKFKLVKSNSCSSRLELTGTDDGKNARTKFRRQLSKEDPPLVCDDENSVKNKICRLESYSKGIAKTPFDNKDIEIKRNNVQAKVEAIKRNSIEVKKIEVASEQQLPAAGNIKEDESQHGETNESQVDEARTTATQADRQSADPQSFEKKFYYVNDNLDQTKAATGKFGEMVFEEFEVLESCYDSLNSNKSLK